MDVSDEKDVERLVQESLQKLGRIDILVNNAGFRHHSAISSTSVEDWEKSMKVNLRGTFLCSREAATR